MENLNLGFPTPELTALGGRPCDDPSTAGVSDSSLGPPVAPSDGFVCQFVPHTFGAGVPSEASPGLCFAIRI